MDVCSAFDEKNMHHIAIARLHCFSSESASLASCLAVSVVWVSSVWSERGICWVGGGRGGHGNGRYGGILCSGGGRGLAVHIAKCRLQIL